MHYALKNKYPIETEGQLKTASDYFDKYINRFDATERAVIASNIEKRASDLSVDIDADWIKNYSRITKTASAYSPDFEYNMKMRKEACMVGNIKIKTSNQSLRGEDMIEKISSQKSNISPKDMVNLISEFDKLAGLECLYDDRINDPIFTVFGSSNRSNYDRIKVASGLFDTDIVSASRDKDFIEKVSAYFGEKFAEDFRSKPLNTFTSMSAPEKSLMIEKISACSKASKNIKNKDKKKTNILTQI